MLYFDKLLDKLFVPSLKRIRKVDPEKIEVTQLYNSSKEATIIFSGWMERKKDFDSILKKYSVKENLLIFNYPKEIINPSPELSKEYFDLVYEIALTHLNILLDSGIKRVKVVGISLGGIFAAKMINRPEVKEAVMIVPGTSLAESFWKGDMTKKLRKIYENEGTNLQKLKRIWNDWEPYKNMQNYKGKKITVYVSESDIVIPYTQGSEFCDYARKNGAKVKMIKNKFEGHILTIATSLTKI